MIPVSETIPMEKAVFLDRDGTIVEDTGYLHEIINIKFLPGVVEAIKSLNENGYKVIVVTNQAGVARGYFDEDAVREVNGFIQQSLSREGAFIDGIYYCPHHAEGVIEEYRKDCYCRKPNPGMIEKAACDFNVDLKLSFMIGDNTTDAEAGIRAGCRTVLLSDINSQRDTELTRGACDAICSDLYLAVRWLLTAEGKSFAL